MIANEIKEKINLEGTGIDKIEVVGGFLNFFVSKKCDNKRSFGRNYKKKTLDRVLKSKNW